MGRDRQRTLVPLFEVAAQRGFGVGASDWFSPNGMVCYAARANSFVVRSNGQLNKCTVALDTDYNHVGVTNARSHSIRTTIM